MKKAIWGAFLVLILVLGLGLLLAACGGEETTTTTAAAAGPDTTTATTAASTTTAAPTTATTARPTNTFELKFSYHTPPQASIVGYYFNPWCAAIEKATNGQVKITQYAGGSLAKEADQYDAVNSGLCDMGLVIPASTPGAFPQMEYAELPYMFPDAGVGAAVYWDILQKYGAEEDFKDVVVLGVVCIAPAQYVGNVPIANVEDFAGKRIRNDGSMEAKVVQALGATPVEIPTSELVPSLERGMADGCFLTWSAVFSFGVADITKNRTKCDIFYRVWPIVINKSVWDSLGSEIQAEIMSVSGQAASVHYSEMNEGDAFGTMKGLEGQDKGAGKPAIVMLTDEQKASWKAKLMPLWDEWAASIPTGADIIADIAAGVQKYSAEFPSTTTTMGSTETTEAPRN